MVEIADTVREGKKVRISQKDGTTEEHADMVERSRLMMDARKWLASKLAPKTQMRNRNDKPFSQP